MSAPIHVSRITSRIICLAQQNSKGPRVRRCRSVADSESHPTSSKARTAISMSSQIRITRSTKSAAFRPRRAREQQKGADNMRKLIKAGYWAALLSACLTITAEAQQLITNGSFESGFTGWTRADQVG